MKLRSGRLCAYPQTACAAPMPRVTMGTDEIDLLSTCVDSLRTLPRDNCWSLVIMRAY